MSIKTNLDYWNKSTVVIATKEGIYVQLFSEYLSSVRLHFSHFLNHCRKAVMNSSVGMVLITLFKVFLRLYPSRQRAASFFFALWNKGQVLRITFSATGGGWSSYVDVVVGKPLVDNRCGLDWMVWMALLLLKGKQRLTVQCAGCAVGYPLTKGRISESFASCTFLRNHSPPQS